MKKKILLLTITFLLNFNSGAFAQTNDDCLTCHSDNSLTMDKNGKTVSIFTDQNKLLASAHKKLQCVQCHQGFNPEEFPHKENITPINCLSCHQQALNKHSFHPDILKTKGLGNSIAVSCKGCHGTHEVKRVKTPGVQFNSATVNQQCSKCHKDVYDSFIHSSHNKALLKGTANAPTCVTCHANQITLKNAKNKFEMKLAQEKLCVTCHADKKSSSDSTKAFIKNYESSVHGAALLKGNDNAANCVDCHNSHSVQKGSEQTSKVFRRNIPETCGKCHIEIAKEYNESIHGTSSAKGNTEAPVCTDCHGEHNILKTNDPNSPVSFGNVSAQVCSPCHSSVALSKKYGMDPNRFSTFQLSYHGLALAGGSTTVANCASCHGVHNIKPSSDPTSMVNKKNMAVTCGKCHPGANERFAEGKIHVTEEREDAPILYWISTTYIVLLITVLGGMFLHNVLDFYRKSKRKMAIKKGEIAPEHHGHHLYLRMSLAERIQHAALALSFILLVITGFMLRFPNAWWVKGINDLIPNAFEMRSLLHRISAVVLIAASLYHIYYVSFTKRGRQLIFDLLPRYQDLKDAIGVMKYNLGIQKVKPLLDRFSYIEKAEYWALVWGNIVMGATGFIMWFENYFIGIFSKLGWDIARTIHYYEAWLAFLAIVIWHFYFVIFNPDVYPMNLAWLRGTLTEEEMADEHPLELERMKKQQEEEDNKQ